MFEYLRRIPRWLSVAIVLLILSSLLLATAAAAPLEQADEAEWLLMFYVDADDDTLELDMLIDLQEAELVGSTDQVHIVAQVDRFKGSFDGMGDFTGAKRFYITQDEDVNVIGSEVIDELGEVNMADSETLLDFITWAVENYPAKKRMLVLSDHGIGWPGGFGDPDPDVQGAHNIFLREAFGHDNLWLMEIDETLAKAQKATGIEQFDIVGFDACLMAQLEIFSAIAPYARYSVASEETEPGVGWAYTAFLSELVKNPEMDGADLSQAIVATYIDQDMRPRIDPDFAGGLEPEVVAAQLFHDATLTAVDLSQLGAVHAGLNDLTVALSAIDQKAVAQARSYAQSYESVFGDEWPSPYIDLGSFLGNVTTQSQDPNLKLAADALMAAVGDAVIAERHGAGRPGSTGIAIYFPVPALWAMEDNWGYTQVAARFAEASQWDEFLAFHSSGGAPQNFSRPKPSLSDQVNAQFGELIAPEDVEILFQDIADLQAEGYTPEEIASVLVDEWSYPAEVVEFLAENGALGDQTKEVIPPPSTQAKPIRVSPIALSAEVVEPGAPVNIQAEISGDQVGYVYSFIGRFLPGEDVLIIEDRDYIFAEENQTVGGVTYPVWPEEGFYVDFDWEPTVYAISDGETALRVLFQPESYGDTPTYSVEAIYHFANGSEDRYARLFFRDGELAQILGFTGATTNGVGAPWEIRPTAGDSVTILQQGLALSAETDDDSVQREVGDLTFGETKFYIEETPAPSGNYVVGIIAEGLNGETFEQYEGLFVVNQEAEVEDGVLPYVNDPLAFALLYPEEWITDESTEGTVSFVSPDETSAVTISQASYPDAASPAEANEQALIDAVEGLGTESDLTDLEFAESTDFVLGAFEARIVDFSATLDDIPLLGSVVAATPQSGMTFVVLAMAQDDVYEDTAPVFDGMFFSFDVLISGIERSQPGAALPEVGEALFADDFSDPTSGLYGYAETDGWGYYDAKTERYIYALPALPGATYDYYADVALPDSFALQISTSYTGTDNNAYGLIFQVMDDESFYLFRVSGDGYFIVEKSSADGVEPLIDWTIADVVAMEEGGENLLTVVGRGGEYDLYINSVQVGSFNDEDYSGGSVGIVADAYDPDLPASFFFDELVVFELAE